MPKPEFTITRAARIVYEDRKRFLLEVGFPNYRAYLASDLWKSIRARVLTPDAVCEYCGVRATQVHHSSYWPAVLRGDAMHALHPICKGCHKRGEFGRNGIKRSPVEATRAMKEQTSRRKRSTAHLGWEGRARERAKQTGRFAEYLAIMRAQVPRPEKKRALLAAFG